MAIDNFLKGSSWFQGLKALPHFGESIRDLLSSSLAINILSLALPITLMQVYDRIIGNEAKTTLVWLVFGCCSAILLETALRLARSHVSGWMAARFDHLVGVGAVERVLSTPLQIFEKDGVGVHLERIYAINTLRGFYAGQIFQVMLDLPFSLIFIATIWLLNAKLVLVPLVVITIFLTIFTTFKWQFEKNLIEQGLVNDRRYNFIIELLSGIHLVKSLSLEEQMLRRYDRLQASAAKSNMKVTTWSELPTNIGGLFSQFMMFGIIAVGGPAVMDGSMTLGTLTACTLLGGRALQPIQSAGGFWMRFANAKMAREQLQELAELPLEFKPGIPTFPNELEGHIKLDNVSFRYTVETPYLLKDVKISLAANKMVGISGSSAVGTTTLAYLLMGILKPENGVVYLDDFNLAEWNTSNLHGRIEYLPQNGVLFSGSIIDNIAMFNPLNRAAALDAAALFGLNDLVSNLAQGYETKVTSQSNDTMPTGLIQKIAIARAFVLRPRILLFDKSNVAMDRESEEIFLDFFKRMKGRSTIILISNQANLLSLCDEQYLLENANLIPSGESKRLLADGIKDVRP
ncbi:MAG: ATP-binding cassette domain-containing protein [Magnetococcales bacterium]|nr:ATP-binding cassette domain-containing protein [Magnetococcales bacterium]